MPRMLAARIEKLEELWRIAPPHFSCCVTSLAKYCGEAVISCISEGGANVYSLTDARLVRISVTIFLYEKG